ncbi:MAG: tRNA 2-thiouridine(34) synthase MnmA [Clostridia bacterium]|nr:tRNA 2-thiouridine(34) synthase MnmA [Clostridia bacterium]
MKMIVGMSGGVDSSYTARKLLSEGNEVIGAFLAMHGFAEADAAQNAASRIGIELYTLDCMERFDSVVKANFVGEYLAGRTPNPCIICNPNVKFSSLLELSDRLGADKIATGHYARVITTDKYGTVKKLIAMANDRSKDQSYMLYRLTPEIIDKLYLPLGEMTKSEVRDELTRLGLSDLDKKDSQEICFIPDDDYVSYIESKVGRSEAGSFIDEEGRVLGRHSGIINYTVGQRKGLGISLGERMFVTEIDAKANTVRLGRRPTESDRVELFNMVMHVPAEVVEGLDTLSVKLRYAQSTVPCRIRFMQGGRAELILSEPARSVTPGQSAVVYDGETVVCGGIICK